MMRVARIMYGLPVPLDRSGNAPLGYDSVKEVDGVVLAWPNDEAFKLLVQAKYLMEQSSTRKVAIWLDKELHKIGYDFSLLCKYNKNKRISHTTINGLLKYRPPLDECLLDLDERERIFRVEAKSSIPSIINDGGDDGGEADKETSESSESREAQI